MSNILNLLPATDGDIFKVHNLAHYTWFKVGGPAEILFIPNNRNDLVSFIKQCPKKIPLTLLGAGSNVLIRDGGINGVTILTKNLNSVKKYSDNSIIAECGALDMEISRFAQRNNLGGLEFLIGIPGSLGGAIIMNSGCFGKEIKDILIEIECINRKGEIMHIPLHKLDLSYRNSQIPSDLIILSAKLMCFDEINQKIKNKMKNYFNERKVSQPYGVKTGGSTFKNPKGKKSWQLIDNAGCRGLKFGAAQISDKHCNFIINTGNASASDIEILGETVRKRVYENSGINLKWEIFIIGQNNREII